MTAPGPQTRSRVPYRAVARGGGLWKRKVTAPFGHGSVGLEGGRDPVLGVVSSVFRNRKRECSSYEPRVDFS